MNKNQVIGRVEAKGKVKGFTGNLLIDDELELEGNAVKKTGKIKRSFRDINDDIKTRKIKRAGMRSSSRHAEMTFSQDKI